MNFCIGAMNAWYVTQPWRVLYVLCHIDAHSVYMTYLSLSLLCVSSRSPDSNRSRSRSRSRSRRHGRSRSRSRGGRRFVVRALYSLVWVCGFYQLWTCVCRFRSRSFSPRRSRSGSPRHSRSVTPKRSRWVLTCFNRSGNCFSHRCCRCRLWPDECCEVLLWVFKSLRLSFLTL